MSDNLNPDKFIPTLARCWKNFGSPKLHETPFVETVEV